MYVLAYKVPHNLTPTISMQALHVLDIAGVEVDVGLVQGLVRKFGHLVFLQGHSNP